MTIEVGECRQQDEWDALVGRSLNPTAFHTWPWLKAVEKHTGCRLHALMAKLGTNNLGIMPVFSKKTKGMRLISSPPLEAGLPYLGPLITPYDVVLKQQTLEKSYLSFIDSCDSYLRTRYSPNYVSLSTIPSLYDARPLTWNKYSVSPQYLYSKDLSGGEDALLGGFAHEAQAEIHLSEKAGVTVVEGGSNAIPSIPPLPGLRPDDSTAYLARLYSELGSNQMRILTAEYRGEPAGILVCAFHKGYATQLILDASEPKDGVHAGSLLQLEAMKLAFRAGCCAYELGDGSGQLARQTKTRYNPGLSVHFTAQKYSPNYLKPIIREILLIRK